jgi:hypothetical protein
MVKNKKFIIFTIFIISVIGTFLVYHHFTELTPEEQIRKRLSDFLAKASKKSGDKLSTGLLKSQALKGFFVPECSFQIGVSSFSGKYTPEQIYANSMRYRTLFKQAKFMADDVEITFISPIRSRVDFTGTLSGETKSGKRIDNYRNLSCIVDFIDNKWLISEVKMREIIKK